MQALGFDVHKFAAMLAMYCVRIVQAQAACAALDFDLGRAEQNLREA